MVAAMRRLRALTLGLAALAALAFTVAVAARLRHPYDLEWLEGATVVHALRLAAHQPIYAAPSLDFVALPYTPLYPFLVALVGASLPAARALSLASFVAALAGGWWLARRGGASRAWATAAMTIPIAAYVPTGAWVDLARVDSLFLALTTWALALGWSDSLVAGAAAALLMVAAFFTKQTAAVFLVGLGVALVVARRRAAWSYAATLVLVGLPALFAADRATSGWFWFYVSELHRAHSFAARRAVLAPLRVLALVGPAAALVPWTLARAPKGLRRYTLALALLGLAAAALGRGTQGGYQNAFLPGVLLGAIAIGAAALDGAAAWGLLALSLVCAAAPWQRATPKIVIPGTTERAHGDALVARLRATDGEVWVPEHPYYAHLAKKPIRLSIMGVNDLARADRPPPPALVAALVQHRFAAVALDDELAISFAALPELWSAYREAERFAGWRWLVPRS
jgi:hypothetical protein